MKVTILVNKVVILAGMWASLLIIVGFWARSDTRFTVGIVQKRTKVVQNPRKTPREDGIGSERPESPLSALLRRFVTF